MNTVPASSRGGEDAVARVEGRGERLLEQHVQARGERFGRDRLVQVVRHRDQRRVEVAVVERGGERRVRGARRCGRRRAARCAASGSTAAVTVIGTPARSIASRCQCAIAPHPTIAQSHVIAHASSTSTGKRSK